MTPKNLIAIILILNSMIMAFFYKPPSIEIEIYGRIKISVQKGVN
jgi:hypothetical protein